MKWAIAKDRFGSATDHKHALKSRPHLEVKRKERVKKRTLPLEARLLGVEQTYRRRGRGVCP